jgi:hypothetical protein
MAKKRKKTVYRHAVINDKKYYFYTIKWADIMGDSSHATVEEFEKMTTATMITQAYVFKKDSNYVWTFSSYDEKEEVFSDRNIFPKGCILKMEKVIL